MENEIFEYLKSDTQNPHPSRLKSGHLLPEGEGGKGMAIKLESDVFPRLAQEGKLYGYLHEGMWLDVSNSAAYKQAVKEVKSL
jgi:NDP-sugar pyrophosphorylase family protein